MKGRLFLDTNIVIDYLSKREPFGEEAYALFQSRKEWQLCVSALSFTTIYYVLRKGKDHQSLLVLLGGLCQLVEILPTDDRTIVGAISSGFSDFEDAVQYYTALSSQVDIIITRNVKDYICSSIPVMTPTEFLSLNKNN